MGRISQIFKNKNIEFIVLKGLTINELEYRDFGDLDILVKEKDLLKAADILYNLEYYYKYQTYTRKIKKAEINDISKQLTWNNEFPFYNNKTKLTIEIHTNIFKKSYNYYRGIDETLENIDSFWENKVYNEFIQCYSLSDIDRLILMCLYTATKRSLYNDNFALRGLLDIEKILTKKIDLDLLVSRTIQLKLVPFVYFALNLTYQIFDNRKLPELLKIFEKKLPKAEKFICYIHSKCFYNFQKGSILYTKLYQIIFPLILGKGFLFKIKNLFLLNYFFPPRRKMQEMYHINQNSPLILLTYLMAPLRWFYLIIKRIFNKI